MKSYKIIQGDNIASMREMPDNSVDSIVTDPPYGLGRIPDINAVLKAWMAGETYTQTGGGFMGKEWDSFVPGPDIWRECLRVLKPGGHLLAFAGTRTQDVMALSLRMAGFEIRDMIAWVYGTGFPKSLDVSKAIDKQDAVSDRHERAIRFTSWLRETGITAAQVNEITGTVGMASHYLSRGSQPAVPTREHLELLRPHLPPIPQWVEDMVDQRIVASENFAARPVIGTAIGQDTSKATFAAPAAAQGVEKRATRELNITAANTPEAAEWEGWGTALKPALEPITVARKPLFGTVAENVLRHGTGAINIDGCRVAGSKPDTTRGAGGVNGRYGPIGAQGRIVDDGQGRFPANLIHDGSDEVLALFPETKVGGGVRRPNGAGRVNTYTGGWGADIDYQMPASEGSAARYFYCAKASKRDRDEGLDSSRNVHPTVKPTQLMRYLCRLVTPPGGVVLDPFCGSGSTGKAAMLEGFRFIGCELDPDYVEIAEARCEWAVGNPDIPKAPAEDPTTSAVQSDPAEPDRGQQNLFSK